MISLSLAHLCSANSTIHKGHITAGDQDTALSLAVSEIGGSVDGVKMSLTPYTIMRVLMSL